MMRVMQCWFLLVIPYVVVGSTTTTTTTTTEQDLQEILNTMEDGTATTTSKQQQQAGQQSRHRGLEDNDGDGLGPYVYSKMATIVPDPLLSYKSAEEETETKQALEEKYGRWHFWDGEQDIRPGSEDYCAAFPHRDILDDFFPDDSWQTDAVFVNHLLNDGENLISRSLEAIFTEYGRGKPLPPEGFAQRAEMFQMEQLDLSTATGPSSEFLKRGGWTTERSNNGLIRRLLHAIMTNDEFVVAIAGDATAAGYGNHFHQSYVMQFHRIVSPVLARFGVKLVTRNLAAGHNVGTRSTALGYSSFVNDRITGDVDVLIWDGSGNANDGEEDPVAVLDLFFRQGILSGGVHDVDKGQPGKIPYLLLGNNAATTTQNYDAFFNVLKFFHNELLIDVGQLGKSIHSIPITESDEKAKSLPPPFQYVVCNDESLCQPKRHCVHCWLDRPDVAGETLFPHLKKDSSSSASSHYPGWREHELMGRNLAFVLLDALQDAVSIFSAGTMGGPPLDEDEWHVTEMYRNMRIQIRDVLLHHQQECQSTAKNQWKLPERICSVSMQGATEHTPRPAKKGITDLIAAAAAGNNDVVVPTNPKKMQYEGPNVHNECLDAGNTVAQVVSLRRQRRLQQQQEERATNMTLINSNNDDSVDPIWTWMPPVFQTIHQARMWNQQQAQDQQRRQTSRRPRGLSSSKYTQGKGWSIYGEKPGQCDGQYLSICGRDSTDPCPLLGYHDSRGELVGNDACGWLVLELPNLQHGIVIIQYSFYFTKKNNDRQRRQLLRSKNMGSSKANNGKDPLLERIMTIDDNRTEEDQQHEQRRLGSASELDDSKFAFVFSINDGPETSWKKQDVLDKTTTTGNKHPVETMVLLDDPNFVADNTAKTVPLAMKVEGCASPCIFALSHVYWA